MVQGRVAVLGCCFLYVHDDEHMMYLILYASAAVCMSACFCRSVLPSAAGCRLLLLPWTQVMLKRKLTAAVQLKMVVMLTVMMVLSLMRVHLLMKWVLVRVCQGQ
jgi:hypothetical protein